jgi:trehalose-phosphatase
MMARSKRAPAQLERARSEIQKRVVQAKSLFIVLDYDTVVLTGGSRAENARPTEEAIEVLAFLAKSPGVRVAVFSAQGLEELRTNLPVAELALGGLHGLETWPHSPRRASRIDIHAVRADLERLIYLTRERIGTGTMPRVEDKRHAVLFHFKGFPRREIARMQKAVRAAFEEVGECSTLVLVPGPQSMEARIAGVEKGPSAHAMQARLAPRSLVIVVGDKTTQEDFFAAFSEEAVTVVISAGALKSRARYRTKSPEEAIAWLRGVGAAWRERAAPSSRG